MTTLEFTPVELPSRYAKAIVAILTAGIAVLVPGMADSVLTGAEVIGVGIAVLTAVGVYLVPNLPTRVGTYAKFIVAIVGTALQAAAPLLLEGTITPSGWLMIVLAALGAVGVNIVPNAPAEPVVVLENEPEDSHVEEPLEYTAVDGETDEDLAATDTEE